MGSDSQFRSSEVEHQAGGRCQGQGVSLNRLILRARYDLLMGSVKSGSIDREAE